jgi:hypothetical protein
VKGLRAAAAASALLAVAGGAPNASAYLMPKPQEYPTKAEVAACAGASDEAICLLGLLARGPRAAYLLLDHVFATRPSLLQSVGLNADLVRAQIAKDPLTRSNFESARRHRAALASACAGAPADAALAPIDALNDPKLRVWGYLGVAGSARASPEHRAPPGLVRAAVARWERDREAAKAIRERQVYADLFEDEALAVAQALLAIGDKAEAERVSRIDLWPGAASEIKRLTALGRFDEAVALAESSLAEVGNWWPGPPRGEMTGPHGEPIPLCCDPHARSSGRDTKDNLVSAAAALSRELVAQGRRELVVRVSTAILGVPRPPPPQLLVLARHADNATTKQWAEAMAAEARKERNPFRAIHAYKALYLIGDRAGAQAVLDVWIVAPEALGYDETMLLWEGRYDEAARREKRYPAGDAIVADLQSGKGFAFADQHVSRTASLWDAIGAYQTCTSEMRQADRAADEAECLRRGRRIAEGQLGQEEQFDSSMLGAAGQAAIKGDLATGRQLLSQVLQAWKARRPLAERRKALGGRPRSERERWVEQGMSDRIGYSGLSAMENLARAAAGERPAERNCGGIPLDPYVPSP